jgi:hypothetical protein
MSIQFNHSSLTISSGFVSGSSADPRYNLSYIVKTASDIGKPIIAVSLNYRLAGTFSPLCNIVP